jgi:hypothetical protein
MLKSRYGLHFLVLHGLSPMILTLIEGDPPKPLNMEVPLEQENVSETLETLHLCRRVRLMVLDEMKKSFHLR